MFLSSKRGLGHGRDDSRAHSSLPAPEILIAHCSDTTSASLAFEGSRDDQEDSTSPTLPGTPVCVFKPEEWEPSHDRLPGGGAASQRKTQAVLAALSILFPHFTHSFIYPFIHLGPEHLIHSFLHPSIHPSIHVSIHHLAPRYFIHSFIYPLIFLYPVISFSYLSIHPFPEWPQLKALAFL